MKRLFANPARALRSETLPNASGRIGYPEPARKATLALGDIHMRANTPVFADRQRFGSGIVTHPWYDGRYALKIAIQIRFARSRGLARLRAARTLSCT